MSSTTSSGNSRLLPAVILLVLIACVFGRSLTGGFVFDDHELIERNHLTDELNPVTHLTSPFWADSDSATEYYRPFTSWSWAVERAAFGAQPWGHHLGNLLLHALSTCLLYLLLSRIARPWAAWLAAAIFALHPVQTEAVSWISGRPDLLVTALLLAALLSYSRVPDRPGRAAMPSVGLFIVLLGLALLTKELAVTLPVLCLAIDLAHARQRGSAFKAALTSALRRMMRLGAYYVVPIAGYLMLRYQVVGQLVGGKHIDLADSLHPLATASLGVRWLTAVEVAAEYLRLIVYPIRLTADYKFDVIPLVVSPFTARFAMSCAGLLIAGVIAVSLARRRPAALFGLIASLGTYALLSHVLFAAPVIMAERFLYLPMAGLSLILALSLLTAARRLSGGKQRTIPLVLALMVLSLLGVRSFIRAGEWKNDLTLFESAVQSAPRSTLAWNNLGHAQQARGDMQAALHSFEESLFIHPDYLRSRQNHATLLRELGEVERAERELRLILTDHPDSGDAWLNLAQLLSSRADHLLARGLTADAQPLLEECITIARRQADIAETNEATAGAAAFSLTAAVAFQSLGDAEQAEEHFLSALELSERAQENASTGVLRSGILSRFAIFLIQSGRPDDAAQRFEQATRAALASGSRSTAARLALNASRAYLIVGNGDAALASLTKAASLNDGDAELQEEIYLEMAPLLVMRGELEQAVALADKGSTSTAILRGTAEAVLASGSPAQALPLYDRIIDTDPTASRARLGRARTLLAIGEMDRARVDLEILEAEHPGGKVGAAIYTDLARIALTQQDDTEALRFLGLALDDDPASGIAYYHRGQLLLRGGDLASAETDLTAALQSGLPDRITTADCWCKLADTARLRGDDQTASEREQRCHTLDPAHPTR